MSTIRETRTELDHHRVVDICQHLKMAMWAYKQHKETLLAAGGDEPRAYIPLIKEYTRLRDNARALERQLGKCDYAMLYTEEAE